MHPEGADKAAITAKEKKDRIKEITRKWERQWEECERTIDKFFISSKILELRKNLEYTQCMYKYIYNKFRIGTMKDENNEEPRKKE